MSWLIWGKHLSIEWRTGTGIDLEFVDSRPVWTQNSLTGAVEPMPFKGWILLLPCVIISCGNVYTFEEDEE